MYGQTPKKEVMSLHFYGICSNLLSFIICFIVQVCLSVAVWGSVCGKSETQRNLLADLLFVYGSDQACPMLTSVL